MERSAYSEKKALELFYQGEKHIYEQKIASDYIKKETGARGLADTVKRAINPDYIPNAVRWKLDNPSAAAEIENLTIEQRAIIEQPLEAIALFDTVVSMAGAGAGAIKLARVVSAEGAASGGTASTAVPKRGIYEFPDKTAGDIPYVGQSGNIPKRLAQHESAGRLTSGTEATRAVEGGKTAREIAEHRRIQELTGGIPARLSPNVANKVDPIGPNRQQLLKEE